VIGMLPGDLQQITVYSAGVTTSARNAEGAKAIIAAMASPSARPIYKAKGMEPR
jgi:molybdate transport system substrate-binding protein